MRLIIVGSEYAGKTTLVNKLSKWWKDKTGAKLRVHDHFTFPMAGNGEGERTRAGVTEEELAKLKTLGTVGKEMYQRFSMEYHLSPNMHEDDDMVLVGFHIEDAVYGPKYYGYGGPNKFGDRVRNARRLESLIMKNYPHTVLVLVTASKEEIRKRMISNPYPQGVLQEEDIEYSLEKFKEEYGNSLIRNKFILDTTDESIEGSFNKLLWSLQPHFRPIDTLRMLQRKFLEEELK